MNLLLRFWDYEQGSITLAGSAAGGAAVAPGRGRTASFPWCRSRLSSFTPRSVKTSPWRCPRAEEEMRSPSIALETAQLSRPRAPCPRAWTRPWERGARAFRGRGATAGGGPSPAEGGPDLRPGRAHRRLDDGTADRSWPRWMPAARKDVLVISHRERDFRLADRVVRFKNSFQRKGCDSRRERLASGRTADHVTLACPRVEVDEALYMPRIGGARALGPLDLNGNDLVRSTEDHVHLCPGPCASLRQKILRRGLPRDGRARP